MRSNLLFTTALISLSSLIRTIPSLTTQRDDPVEEVQTPTLIEHEDLLARGYRVPLECVNAPTLERIPTISTKTAEKILLSRDKILKRDSDGNLVTFASIKGIGKKGSTFLERYISYRREPTTLFTRCE